jgi:hypothetical protein
MKISAVVTQSCLKDFLLMKKTFDLYHTNHIYDLACDAYSFDYLNKNFNNLKCCKYNDLEDGSHTEHNNILLNNFKNIIKIKFEHTLKILQSSNDIVLWCDTDHIFVNSIDEFVYQDTNDALITPHYSNNFANENEVGFFNCGFVFIKNVEFLIEWKRLYDQHEKLNIYFEQKALELACKKFKTTNLPINYNVGWWKFMNEKFEGNFSYLKLENDNITLYGNKLINFHFHFFKEDKHSFDKNQFRNLLFSILKQRSNQEDLITLYEIERLSNENI